MTHSARVAALYYYPVKSARGIALPRATLGDAGFLDDRRWMVVTSDWRFLTQRELPRLALVQPELSSAQLLLQAPAMPPLNVPLARQGARQRVRVWKDDCEAFDEGDDVADWLQQLLERDCRLVRFDPSQRRLSSRTWTGGLEADLRFADAFPILALSMASLQDLNSRLAAPLPMNRFRANLVLEQLQAYDEDRIDELYSSDVRLKVVKPCARCKITTTDQDTGEVAGDEPLRTLMAYRYDAQLHGACFGQNLIVVQGAGAVLEVGQQLSVRWKGAVQSG